MTHGVLLRYGWATFIAVALCSLIPAAAQEGGGQEARTNGPAVATPRMPDGKPDLSGRWGGGGEGAIAIRLPNGQQTKFPSYAAYEEALALGKVDPASVVVGRQTNYRHANNDYSGKDEALMWRLFGNPPLYRPEHWERVQANDLNGNKEDPALWTCMPGGIPRMGPPAKIIQTEKELVFLYGTFFFMNNNSWRVIPLDGRGHHPVYSKDQTFMGDTKATWEGDTLVLDVEGFNDFTWLGWPGWFHSAEMRVVEKFRRVGNELHYSATVYDPEVLLEPWEKDPQVLRINPSTVYTEEPPCQELDQQHIVSRMR